MDGGIGEVALAEAAFDTAAFEGLNAASVLGTDAAITAGAAGATGAAANAFDPAAFEGISQYMGTQAPINPVTQAINAGNMANVTGNAPNAFQGITELNAQQTADLMRNIDPRMIDAYQPYFNESVADTANVASKGVDLTGNGNTLQSQMDLSNRVGDIKRVQDFMPAFNSGPVSQMSSPGFLDQASAFAKEYKNPLMMAGTSLGLRALMNADSRRYGVPGTEKYTGPLSKFSYNPSNYQPDIVKPPAPYRPQYAGGGPVEQMSNNSMMGVNTMYPMANISTSSYGTPDQMAEGGITHLASGGFFKNVLGDAAQLVGDIGGGAVNLVSNLGEGRVSLGTPDHGGGYQPEDYSKNSYTYDPNKYKTYTAPNPNTYKAQYAGGGIAQLAVGGKLLRGQGDGMSDSIKANISGKREARLADGEFVVPADVVSHLGNGSTDAGAKQLYSMMDKVRQARVGSKKQGKQIDPMKYMPA
jgi:hypothetical protein